MTQCQDRFERRLVEETSKLRVDVAQFRGEMQVDSAHLRGDLQKGFADLRGEVATGRFELLRWSFGFWVAQLVAVAGIIGVLLRTYSAR